MNYILRSGSNIKIAFESGFKQQMPLLSRSEGSDENTSNVVAPALVHEPSESDTVRHNFWLKILLRKFAKYFYFSLN